MTARDVIDRYGRLAGQRATLLTHWQEIADLADPSRARFTTQTDNNGLRPKVAIYDNTGILGARTLASAIHGMLTNPAQEWFEMTTGNQQLDASDDVRAWIEEVAKIMLGIMGRPETGFYPQIHQAYADLTLFGTCVVFTAEKPGMDGVYFQTRFLGEIVIAENAEGFVDTVMRCFKFSARQAVQYFGIDAVSDKTRKTFEKEPDKQIEFIHAVYPRDDAARDQETQSADPKKRPIVDMYVERETMHVCREGGFYEMPFAVARWDKQTGEVWGRGAGMVALPAMKTANTMKATILKAGQKTVDPPLMIPDEGIGSAINLSPGAINVVGMDAFQRNAFPRPMIQDLRVDIGMDLLQAERDDIRSAFFVDMLMTGENAQMTATEVIQRVQERLLSMGASVGRIQSELLGPIIDRVFLIMLRAGQFPPIPQALQGENVRPRYKGVLARGQRGSEAQGIQQVIGIAASVAQLAPGVMDLIDMDQGMRDLNEILGAPAGLMRDRDEVDKIRAERAQQQQQAQEMAMAQQAAQAAQQGAGAVKSLADAQAAGAQTNGR
jgi:hypothetical protein